MSYERQLLIIP